MGRGLGGEHDVGTEPAEKHSDALKNGLRRLISLISLLGCTDISQSADGEWSGSCALEAQGSYDDDSWVDFELDVFEEEEGVIKGEGAFLYDYREFEGKVRGYRDDASLELELEGSDDGHSTRLEISGDIVNNRVRGWCTFYGVHGSLEMSR